MSQGLPLGDVVMSKVGVLYGATISDGYFTYYTVVSSGTIEILLDADYNPGPEKTRRIADTKRIPGARQKTL